MATLAELRSQLANTPQYTYSTPSSGLYGLTSVQSPNPLYAQLRQQIAAQQEVEDPFSMTNTSKVLGVGGAGGTGAGGAGGGYSSSYTPEANPWLGRLQNLLDNPDAIAQSAGYKFRFQQGQQALERSQSAKGMLGSGNTLAALSSYGQSMASDEYGKQMGTLSGLYATEADAGAKRYGADVSAQASNTNSRNDLYANLFRLTGAPGSTQRRIGNQTGNQYGWQTTAGGW